MFAATTVVGSKVVALVASLTTADIAKPLIECRGVGSLAGWRDAWWQE
jgi:hypothetical protein